MNLRILKKLSKRAAPLLPLLGDRRMQFRSERCDNYHGMVIRDRTCWDRSRCHPTYRGHGDEIVFDSRAGHRVVMRPPPHPLKGTMMVGATSGYYQPEWDEECAWSALVSIVHNETADWAAYPEVGNSRRFNGVGDIFRAAHELIADRQSSRTMTAADLPSRRVGTASNVGE